MPPADRDVSFSAPHVVEYAYRRSVGAVLGRFFTGLRERKLLGTRTRAGRVLVPPCEYDPDTGEQLPYGEEGELVFTTLTKEAMPVLRYRTRDRTILHAEQCACGRTNVRMEKILGRTDDMLIVRGVNVFPQLIEKTLLSIEDIEPHYQIVIDRPKDQLDTLEVWVEASPRLFQPIDTRRLDELQGRVSSELAQTLGVSASVKLMGPKSIQRSEGKAKRVVDKREL